MKVNKRKLLISLRAGVGAGRESRRVIMMSAQVGLSGVGREWSRYQAQMTGGFLSLKLNVKV